MKQILIIDDSSTARGYYKLILKDLAVEIVEAQNGMEALEKITQKQEIILCLVDINMPIMDGYTFVKKLRQDPKHQTTKVLMISTEAQDIDKQKAFEAGADEYFVKPIDKDEFLATIARLINL